MPKTSAVAEAEEASEATAPVSIVGPSKAEISKALMARHPWHDANSKTEWPLLRAVFAGARTEAEKKLLLVTSKVEKEEHFQTRLKLSHLLGCAENINERLIGRIFQDRAEVDYDGNSELEEWAEDIDGTGTTLEEFLEEHAKEAAGMGLVGIWVDRGLKQPDAISQADEDRSLKLTPYSVEEIVNFGSNPEDGLLEWVILQRTEARQETPFSTREIIVRWIVLDRMNWWHFECKKDKLGTSVSTLSNPSTRLEFFSNLALNEVTDLTPEANVHGTGRVPFAVLYGKKKGVLQGESVLAGAVRADIAGFNADSDATFSEWLHGKPAFWVRSKRALEEVALNTGIAWKLDPDKDAKEEIGYANTPSEAFDHGRKVVEARKLDAHRMVGADPIGLFEQSAQPESGRAKSLRFSASEERVLARLSSAIQTAHFEILDICARMLSSTPLDAKAIAFEGSVRYQSKFDLADAEDLIPQYGEAGYFIESESWHKDMRKRIARLLMGDVSRDRAAVYDQEIDAAPFKKNLPSEQVDNAAAAAADGDSEKDGAFGYADDDTNDTRAKKTKRGLTKEEGE